MARVKALRVQPPPIPQSADLPAMCTAIVKSARGADATVELGGREVHVIVDASVHAAVLEGAVRRGERVVVERDPDGTLRIVGALRTQPTPGVDRSESYTIEADEIRLEAGRELSLGVRAAGMVVRAAGEIETFAERIVSRAAGVHKIIGSILRLN